MDYSPPGSSVHGILQARILEWVAMPSPPGDLPDPGLLHCRKILYLLRHWGSPFRRGEHTEHEGIHNKEKHYQGKECGKAFSQKSGLSCHLKIHTGVMFCMWASLQLQIAISIRGSTLRKNPKQINIVGRL